MCFDRRKWLPLLLKFNQILCAGMGFPYTQRVIQDRKSQTMIPRAVRAALGVKRGDSVASEIRGSEVVIERAPSSSADFVADFSVFTEWDSEADRIAYREM